MDRTEQHHDEDLEDAGRTRRGRRGLLAAPLVALLLVVPAGAALDGPLNDLLALGKGEGQVVPRAATQDIDDLPFEPTPQVGCAPDDRPEPGIQGRVPAGSARNGLFCNARIVGRHGSAGGFKVHRYVDRTGRECAYYDTALLFPLNALRVGAGDSLGVQVLDMTDPTNPRRTAVLTELPMMSPHESLVLNQRRGLLAAVLGNPATYPGLVSIYDASADCRKPVLKSTRLVARFGHESGFSEDGRTFYAAGTATDSLTAIDVVDPARPKVLWQGQVSSHGLTLDPDGTRAYVTDTGRGEAAVLDVHEIEQRKPDPQVREISRMTWTNASIPQNAIHFTVGGRPYLLEFDEYTQGTTGGGNRDAVGAGRIIDIADETRPRQIANLRLAVNQPDAHRAAQNDPGAASPVQGYAAHYCDLDSRVDPTVVACSFIASGLRVFDITDLEKPREIAYVVAPTKAAVETVGLESSFAMSKPVVVKDRREVWYTDGASGLSVVRVADRVWPANRPACTPRNRRFVRLKVPKGAKVRTASARLLGRRATVVRRGGRLGVVVDLRRAAPGTVRLSGTVRTRTGRVVRTVRTFRVCATG
ncbi:LVIVD repeat-containing protein [Paraconexibacter algicola]|uniref:LVIVD repeat-containing protein n=1 Tax=Paraconexibacter algicola TaxID=2133960 RepID=UPI0018EE979E|nr:hypothetical protein [Paraconexibacter algicola]